MKRIVISMLAAVVLAAGSGLAWAEEEQHKEKAQAEQGTEVELGAKVWWNKWKRSIGSISFDSDDTFLVGPVVEVKFHNNVFIEAATLNSTSDYEIKFLGFPVTKADRHDWDLAVGYMISHDIGAFVGYRNSVLRDDFGAKETSYGALAGIRGAVPLTEALSLYGKITYLMNRVKSEDGESTTREKNPGWIFEAGAKYEFTKHVAANLGYQYEKTRGVDSGVNDTFSGVTLGAMYAFE